MQTKRNLEQIEVEEIQDAVKKTKENNEPMKEKKTNVKFEYHNICKRLPFGKVTLTEKCLNFTASCDYSNLRKNRYEDVLCFENTRFRFKQENESISGDSTPEIYINANVIKGPTKTCTTFIATQAPSITTMGDFFEMILQSNSRLVITLSSPEDINMGKINIYWPPFNEKLNFDNLEIKTIEEKVYEEFSITKRTITCCNLTKQKTMKFIHLHYNDWIDGDIPKTKNGILKLMDLQNAFSGNPDINPVIVHCSAGIGRTGVYVSAVHAKEIFNINKSNSLNNVISTSFIFENTRKQRYGAVPKFNQYEFFLLLCENFN